jgi:hypothetical protein
VTVRGRQQGRSWRARFGTRSALLLLALVAGVLATGLQRTMAASPPASALWKIYAPGWNLVAGPGGSTLGLHSETLYTLDGALPAYTSYRQPVARAGEGYWVFYPTGAMLLLIGVPQSVSSVHVTGGNWAILGNSGIARAAVRGADLAFAYDPSAGFSPAGWIQPGQAALVYAFTDAQVFLDPYSQPAPVSLAGPGQAQPQPMPSLPAAQGVNGGAGSLPSGTPADELNYLVALNPILNDVEQQLSMFADNLDLADPAQPTDPVWDALRENAAQVRRDLIALQTLKAPERYTQVQADLESAVNDIGDGMSNTTAGLLAGQPDRITLGAGLLQSGARRLATAKQRLPQ